MGRHCPEPAIKAIKQQGAIPQPARVLGGANMPLDCLTGSWPGALGLMLCPGCGQDRSSPGNAFSFPQVMAEKGQIIPEGVALMLSYRY